MDIKPGDLVEYRSVDGLLRQLRVDRIDTHDVVGQGCVLPKYRVTRIIERIEQS